MKKKATGTQEVIVKCPVYPYFGHPYKKGEVIDMDKHSVPGAIARGQVKIKPVAKKQPAKTTKRKGPSSNRATGPSENR